MRVLAIGDIHGCAKALDRLLVEIAPRPDDVIVTLGDYIDRGPDSMGVIDRLIQLSKTTHLVPLLGNHEEMILQARKDPSRFMEWLDCGGRATLASYSILGDKGNLVDVPDEHWTFLEKTCVPWHETATHLFVHANAYPDMPMPEQPAYMLRWEAFDHPPPHISGKIMVCGHTPQKNGQPRNLGHAVCIDTWACGRGFLTGFDTTSGYIWRVNNNGKVLPGWMDDFLED